MHSEARLQSVISSLPLGVQGGWAFRAVEGRFSSSINSVVGSLKVHGRFHHAADQVGTLYLGLNRESLLYEVHSQSQDVFLPFLMPPPTHDTVPFALNLTRVLDLTDPVVQEALGTGIQELTGSWDYENTLYNRAAPTQILARVAALSGIQALRFLSARTAKLVNLAVFVRNVTHPLSASLSAEHPAQRVGSAQETPELLVSP